MVSRPVPSLVRVSYPFFIAVPVYLTAKIRGEGETRWKLWNFLFSNDSL